MLKMALVLGSMLALVVPAQAQVNSADLKWGPAPPVFPAGARRCCRVIPARQGRS
jgi:hypothetical protein